MKKHLLVALTLLVTSSSYAAKNVRCDYPKNYFEGVQTQHQSLQDLAKIVGPTLCKNALQITDDETIAFEKALTEYAVLANADIISSFPGDIFKGVESIAQLWEEQLISYKVNFDYLNPIFFEFEGLEREEGKKYYALRIDLPPYAKNSLEWKINSEQKKSCKSSVQNIDCKLTL